MIQFRKESTLNEPKNQVFTWHEREGALERLSPPWDPVTVISRSGGIREGAKVHLKMKAGPVPFTWKAEHTKFIKDEMFEDIQKKGPFSNWTHSHYFDSDQHGSCTMRDSISCSFPFGFISNRLMGWKIKNQLKSIFTYRHRILREDIKSHRFFNGNSKTILISGASGIIGTALIPFLLTGGHRVKRLVRNRSQSGPDDVFWDPASGIIDSEKIEGTDIVIHLAGENIGEGR